MKCPFVRVSQVRQCRAAAFRLSIPHAEGAEDDLCLTHTHKVCEVYRAQSAEGEAAERCPYVEDGVAQYCSASRVTKLIPIVGMAPSRCFNGGHRYCDQFVERLELADKPAAGVRYTANHMWIDIADNGHCHIGVDELLARVLGGTLESVGFATVAGDSEPAVLIRSKGVDWPMVFPEHIEVTARNLYLRTNPRRIVTHPYSLGWLFEGMRADALAGNRRLIPADEAREWMSAEWQRLAQFVYTNFHGGSGLMNDGGEVAPDLADRLAREERLLLFNEFFSPSARVRRFKAKRK